MVEGPEPRQPVRRQLIDQVVASVCHNVGRREQVAATVKAFMTADLPHELVDLLEEILLQHSTLSNNPNLQNLLILTAIKADTSRVMNYINLLEDFDGPEVGEIAVGSELYEEAFVIFKVFDLNVQAVNVLLDNIRSIDCAVQFAARAKQNEVWSQVGKAQLREGLVGDAIESFIKADDATQFNEVINETSKIRAYEDMLKYCSWFARKGISRRWIPC